MAKKENCEIEYCGVNLLVTGYYSSEEKRVMYNADLSGYPGTPADFEIYTVQCDRQDIIDLLSYEQIQEIETNILNTHYGHEY